MLVISTWPLGSGLPTACLLSSGTPCTGQIRSGFLPVEMTTVKIKGLKGAFTLNANFVWCNPKFCGLIATDLYRLYRTTQMHI
jgi:hypothetical protein